jgi:hypothetical protein
MCCLKINSQTKYVWDNINRECTQRHCIQIVSAYLNLLSDESNFNDTMFWCILSFILRLSIYDINNNIFAVVEDMNWVQRKIHLYNVTFGLYMLDWWERCTFSILCCTIFYMDFDFFRCLFLYNTSYNAKFWSNVGSYWVKSWWSFTLKVLIWGFMWNWDSSVCYVLSK